MHRHALTMPDSRTLVANAVLLLLVAAAVIVSLSMGTVQIAPAEVIRALIGTTEDPMAAFVINELRLSRVVAGMLSGAALALAGCLMQTLARNRLATPGIIGIDNAATAFAVASVVGTGIAIAPSAMALAGAATATALAFGLAGANGTRGYRFIVAGLGIGAIALGTRLRRTRVVGLGLSVLLTGLAVSVCGPVGLVALLAPELARTVCRPGRIPLTAAALAGAAFMVIADLLGRTLFSPLEIPVGIITAIVGSPYLLWILLRPSTRSLT